MLSADCVNSGGFRDLKGLTQRFCLEMCADGASKRGHDWPGVIFASKVWLSMNKVWRKSGSMRMGVVGEGERKCEAKRVVRWDLRSQK